MNGPLLPLYRADARLLVLAGLAGLLMNLRSHYWESLFGGDDRDPITALVEYLLVPPLPRATGLQR